MPTKFLRLFLPPTIADPLRAQRVAILHLALGLTAVACIPLGFLNLSQDAVGFAILLFLTSAVCVGGLALSHAGHDSLAAALLSVMIFVAIVYTLIDGAGLSDPAVVALPLFILVTSFFFGLVAIVLSTLLSIAAVTGLYLLHHYRLLLLSSEPTESRVIVLCILLACTAGLVAVILRTWERNLQALRRSEQRLDLAIHAAGMAMWDWDLVNERLVVNDLWLQSLEYPADFHPTPRDWVEAIHPDDRGEVLAGFEAHLRGETAAWSPQYRLLTAGRNLIWVQCLGRVMERDATGKALRVSGVQLDVSERRRAEVALLESEDRYKLFSRELHDSVAQTLYSMTLTLRAARLILERAPAEVDGLLAQLDSLVKIALDEMRTLLRHGRPEALDRQGLATALRDHLQGLRDRGELDVHLEIEGEARLPAEVELALYRIAQEALSNVVKHSGVRQADVRLQVSGETARLIVVDHGSGFDRSAGSAANGSFGLASIEERATGLGGRVSLQAQVGAGTRLDVEIPLPGRGPEHV
jgi:signal transduction histidine kinase